MQGSGFKVWGSGRDLDDVGLALLGVEVGGVVCKLDRKAAIRRKRAVSTDQVRRVGGGWGVSFGNSIGKLPKEGNGRLLRIMSGVSVRVGGAVHKLDRETAIQGGAQRERARQIDREREREREREKET